MFANGNNNKQTVGTEEENMHSSSKAIRYSRISQESMTNLKVIPLWKCVVSRWGEIATGQTH